MSMGFVKRFKGIRLRVLFSNRVEDLISSEIDIAVRVVDEPPIDYVARKVAKMHWHLCASPKYLESLGKIRSPQQLEELDFLMPPPSKRTPLLTLERAGERQAVRITTKLESESFPYLQEAAEQDAGIVLLPSYCAIQAVREQKLQRVLPEFQVLQPMNNLYILTAPNPYPSVQQPRCGGIPGTPFG
ncbi:substrate binding domain-containing protein [Achromobacter sp. F4_2707]